MTFSDITLTAIRACKAAGEIVSKDFNQDISVMAKGSHDVVTNTDLQSEKMILSIVKEAFPDHNIISEEIGKEMKNNDYTWYIDPIDGTSNFVCGIPYFAISIGVAFKNKIITGVIYNPILQELYVAEIGKGAFVNGQKIEVSQRNKISESYLATAYSADENDIKNGVKIAERLALNARRVVLNFAPALDLCNIARGRMDGLIDNGSTCEDHAAGSLILTEAGGHLQNLHQSGWDVNITGIIASNGKIHDELCKVAKV